MLEPSERQLKIEAQAGRVLVILFKVSASIVVPLVLGATFSAVVTHLFGGEMSLLTMAFAMLVFPPFWAWIWRR